MVGRLADARDRERQGDEEGAMFWPLGQNAEHDAQDNQHDNVEGTRAPDRPSLTLLRLITLA